MPKKPTLTLWFSDFWSGFEPGSFWLYNLLAEDFAVSLQPNHPDLLVYCDYGIEHLGYSCFKIYYSHENKRPHPLYFDYSFSFRGQGPRHQYFSNLVEERYFEPIRNGTPDIELLTLQHAPKVKFCNFIYSNMAAQERISFCRQLSLYKRVDCPGRVLNNHPPFDAHGYRYEKKLEFMSQYRFTIAFENESAIGYTTEKMLHPLIAGSIPIYWGNPRVAELFNPESFINCHDFASFDHAIAHVKRVDNDEQLYRAYRAAPPILPSSPLAALSRPFLKTRLQALGSLALTGSPISRSILFPILRGVRFVQYRIQNRILYSLEQAGSFFASIKQQRA